MPRTFRVVLFLVTLVTMTVVACKADKPAGTKPGEATKVVDPSKSREPATQTDPAMKPATPAESASDDPAATGSNTELQNKGLAMMQRMSDLFAAHGSDCDKLAAEIKSLVADNHELDMQVRAAEQNQTHDERAAFAARNRAVHDAAMAKMAPVAKACRGNAKFMAAILPPTP